MEAPTEIVAVDFRFADAEDAAEILALVSGSCCTNGYKGRSRNGGCSMCPCVRVDRDLCGRTVHAMRSRTVKDQGWLGRGVKLD